MENKTPDRILENGIIAIARGIYGEKLLYAVGALLDAGIRAVEVTFDQNTSGVDTFEAIIKLKSAFKNDSAIGAGTVLTQEQLKLAYHAGADFIVSPNTDESIIRETKRLGLVSVPGAMTPSEIVAAHSYGADIVKVFPSGALGVEYFSAITTPLSHIRCAAVGGVTLENLSDFKRAGACAFGISSSLFNKKLIENEAFEEISKNAAEFIFAARNERGE
ncbi:MAG: bifunctional 4-hydroxy-2-oxoglutarate aldolase/2-dehydro-3-deoxy-phosphogluconate aldolase [Clostridia bacterium]|nr:bifunctional 4-hydroxy-2-oxoglutarate aldolase/2-dehydro-3-deoxy-phosphogluconate aldolase [Clostridia bacterium]